MITGAHQALRIFGIVIGPLVAILAGCTTYPRKPPASTIASLPVATYDLVSIGGGPGQDKFYFEIVGQDPMPWEEVLERLRNGGA